MVKMLLHFFKSPTWAKFLADDYQELEEIITLKSSLATIYLHCKHIKRNVGESPAGADLADLPAGRRCEVGQPLAPRGHSALESGLAQLGIH